MREFTDKDGDKIWLQHGKGQCTWADKDMEYVGMWHKGQMCGLGKRVIREGKGKDQRQFLYEGEFHNNQPNGFGKYKEKRGKYTHEAYYGYWKDDRPHGNGVQILEDGSIYQGEFVNGD